MSIENSPADIQKSFVVVNESLLADVMPVTETFWSDLDAKYGDFAGHSLIASFSFDDDWPTWEIHPEGDEFVCLLSEDADVTTKPQLEIFADDVKCTHGATIGQIEESQLFYLRSRGIDPVAAHSMLVHAFANETIAEIRVPELRHTMERVLLDRLPRGELRRGGR